jgi:hypothetical protein
MGLDGVEAFIRRFRGHHRVLPHLQEFHQRLADGRIVFDDEYDGGGFSNHAEIIVLLPAEKHTPSVGHPRPGCAFSRLAGQIPGKGQRRARICFSW